MKFQLILENADGERLDMTTSAMQYMVSSVEGLEQPAGTISTSSYAGTDGSYLNHAFIEKRNIVISFAMRGIHMEKRRHALYRVVKPSKYIKIYYRTAGIDVYAEGYVETCEISRFSVPVEGQISIICPDIYFYSRFPVYAYYGRIYGAFHFPFPESDAPFPIGVYSTSDYVYITNSGDAIGCRIIIETKSDVDTPEVAATNFAIYNDRRSEFLRFTGEIRKNDRIEITTKTGHKTATLIRDGVSENAINRIDAKSDWLVLYPGENQFRIENGEFLKVTFVHTDAYLGV